MSDITQKPPLMDAGPEYEQTGLVHRVRIPAGNGPHPTVVMLHGYLGDENVMWAFEKTVPEHWLKLAPRAILAYGTGYSWHERPPQFVLPQWAQYAPPVTRLHRFLTALPEIYDADAQQIYLMGFSQGAALSYATAVAHPGLVQGIAGLVGFMPAGIEKHLPGAPLLHMPIFIAVGTQDKTIPLEVGRRSGALAQMAGAWLEYREYETGHKLEARGMEKLRSWWQERDAEIG